MPDGERILTWTQLYNLNALPEQLIVVGSGVTGAEFAGAYNALGGDVVLVSSRDRVLPGEDADAAELIEEVFRGRGMTVMVALARAVGVVAAERRRRRGHAGRRHASSRARTCSWRSASMPSTAGLGLEEAGVRARAVGPHRGRQGLAHHAPAASTRRATAPGCCPLASVAAMQGRIAMSHALGDAVQPLELRHVAANIFTAPEIATVGLLRGEARASRDRVRHAPSCRCAATRAPRCSACADGFVKLFAHPEAGMVLGGVVVAPRASELIFPITLAVAHRLTVDDVAEAFTVYPSLSGSIAEVARVLHQHRS